TWSLRLASSLFSAVDLLRRLDRHLAIVDHPLELGVFRQLAQALHVRRLRQPKSPPPHVDRRLADLCFLATSATEFPSASRKIATIGSSAKRTFFISSSLRCGSHALKLQLVRKTPAGQRHTNGAIRPRAAGQPRSPRLPGSSRSPWLCYVANRKRSEACAVARHRARKSMLPVNVTGASDGEGQSRKHTLFRVRRAPSGFRRWTQRCAARWKGRDPTRS